MTNFVNDQTEKLNLPLPHPQNSLVVDVERLRQALSMVDAAYSALNVTLSSKAEASGLTSLTNQLGTLKGSVPDALSTLQKLANAIGNDPNYAATQAQQITSLQNAQTAQAGQITSLQNSTLPVALVYAGLCS